MNLKYLPIFLVFTISEYSLAQAVERVCIPAPTEFKRSGYTCFIQAGRNHLAVRVENELEATAVSQSIHDAMERFGFNELSENVFWYPDGRTCYFSLYSVSSNSIFIVPSEPIAVGGGPGYCDLESRRYDAVSFGSTLEQQLARDGLREAVSIYFTTIEEGSELYEEVLENGGTPGFFTLNGDLISIDIQY